MQSRMQSRCRRGASPVRLETVLVHREMVATLLGFTRCACAGPRAVEEDRAHLQARDLRSQLAHARRSLAASEADRQTLMMALRARSGEAPPSTSSAPQRRRLSRKMERVRPNGFARNNDDACYYEGDEGEEAARREAPGRRRKSEVGRSRPRARQIRNSQVLEHYSRGASKREEQEGGGEEGDQLRDRVKDLEQQVSQLRDALHDRDRDRGRSVAASAAQKENAMPKLAPRPPRAPTVRLGVPRLAPRGDLEAIQRKQDGIMSEIVGSTSRMERDVLALVDKWSRKR